MGMHLGQICDGGRLDVLANQVVEQSVRSHEFKNGAQPVRPLGVTGLHFVLQAVLVCIEKHPFLVTRDVVVGVALP